MSLALIEAEIGRFLRSTEPEVLCIKGKWGVGKTYAWKKYLTKAQHSNDPWTKNYSYVSLFGLNSLEDLRFSIFENTVSGNNIVTGPDVASFEALIGKGTVLGRKLKPLVDGALALINRQGVADVLFKTAFLTVRDQLICLDDLERAGSGLSMRDVLGVASFLKEDRKCKVVLLLNDEAMNDESRDEFSKQLEKVADVTLLFALSPTEAVRIALPNDHSVCALLRPRIVELGITNIRVIKRIERLAIQLEDILKGFDEAVLEKAIVTLALAGWSVQQPGIAPPLDFIRGYNRLLISMRDGNGDPDPESKKWAKTIEDYPYDLSDEMDAVIIDGSVSGYFDRELLGEKAVSVQQQMRQHSRNNSFIKTWNDLYYGSLTTDDDEFLDALYNSSLENLAWIAPININSALYMLREHGRGEEADDVVRKYIDVMAEHGPDFFDLRNHPFTGEDSVDDGLRVAFAKHRAEYNDTRVPLEVLRKMAKERGWSNVDLALMAKQSADDFEKMFEALRGNEIKQSIDLILSIGRAGLPESRGIEAAATAALRRIAAKSPLRERKVRRYGIALEAPMVDSGSNVSPSDGWRN